MKDAEDQLTGLRATLEEVWNGLAQLSDALPVEESPLSARPSATVQILRMRAAPPPRNLLDKVFDGTVKLEFPSTVLFRMLSYVPPMHLPPMQYLLSKVDGLVHLVPAFRTQSYFAVVAFRRIGR